MANNPNQNPNQPPTGNQPQPDQTPNKPEGNQVEIIDVRTVPSTEPERAGQMDTLITYQLDPQHVYMLRIQDEDPTSEEIQQAVQSDFKGKQEVIGTQVSV